MGPAPSPIYKSTLITFACLCGRIIPRINFDIGVRICSWWLLRQTSHYGLRCFPSAHSAGFYHLCTYIRCFQGSPTGRPIIPVDPSFPYVGKYIAHPTIAQIKTLDCGSLKLNDFREPC
ncbi:hypothetical protein BD779DRAFT_9370 [Infundibulicybe gibba]|nr:hypothetical protein BD779DRAFT_9370 [Infundibulicybe gibba]